MPFCCHRSISGASTSEGPLKASVQVYTKKQLNFKRNNSSKMTNCMTWDECCCCNETNCEGQEVCSKCCCCKCCCCCYNEQRLGNSCIQSGRQVVNQENSRLAKSQAVTFQEQPVQQRAVSFQGNNTRPQNQQNLQKQNIPAQVSNSRNQQPQQIPAQAQKQRPSSAAVRRSSSAINPKPAPSRASNSLVRFEKSEGQLERERIEKQQRREKITEYIQSLVPYSRSLPNSKFQHYFQKAAPETYGACNTTQPIGGVIYGSNLRSFNVNPHDYQNNPKYYQSHLTALNFAVRTKRDEEKHWNRLEKELSKKLGLHEKNETIQQGKDVVYVDVNDDNMNDVMRENNQFRKAHREEIRAAENQYKKDKHMEFKAEQEKFYREKAEKIQENLQNTLANTMASTVQCDRDDKDRIREQVIYRHTDQDGNVRLGADRHALTCFVDLNFPENEERYTEELKKRMPIYQTEVYNKHKYLDYQRKANFVKSKDNVYPSHYLLPCNEQPQVLKMLVEKGGGIKKQSAAGGMRGRKFQ